MPPVVRSSRFFLKTTQERFRSSPRGRNSISVLITAIRRDFLPVPDPTGEREQQARGWAYGHEGKGYDLWGNVRFLTNLIRDDSDKWFCSEAIMAMLGFKEPYRYGPSGMVAVIAGMFGTQVLERLVENKGKP